MRPVVIAACAVIVVLAGFAIGVAESNPGGTAGPLAFPASLMIPNPFAPCTAPGTGPVWSAPGSSAAYNQNTQTLTFSSCDPIGTKEIVITDDNCTQVATLHQWQAGNSLLIDAQSGEMAAKAKSGSLILGCNDPWILTPGAMLAANSPDDPDHLRATLLLTTIDTYNVAEPDPGEMALLGIASPTGDINSLLLLTQSSPNDETRGWFVADQVCVIGQNGGASVSGDTVSVVNASSAGLAVDGDDEVTVSGNTVHVQNESAAGLAVAENSEVQVGNATSSVAVDVDGNVIIQLGQP